MQCPSCGFQNLPGLPHCARCSSQLALDNVDVQPYRAADRWARWRRWRARWRHRKPLLWSLIDWANRLWDRLRGRSYWAYSRSGNEVRASERMVWVVASIIPGLGHILAKRRRRGLLLGGGYLLVVAGSVLFMSSAWWFFTIVMLSLHTYAVTDCIFYRAGYVSRLIAVCCSLLVFLVLVLGPYRGATWLLGGFARLEQVNVDARASVLKANDIILMNGRWSVPDQYMPGDVVSYSISRQRGGERRGAWFIQAGVLIDRILAGPGDHVVCTKGNITVNGQPLSGDCGLLIQTQLPNALDVVVPPDSYFIYPTLATVNVVRGQTEPEIRTRVALVPAKNVRGKVRMIINPLSRIRSF